MELESSDYSVLPLHGELPADAQDNALLPGDRPKIIVSTNVAAIEKSGPYHLHSFLYSLGHTNPEQVEKQISCDEKVNGYWSPVTGATSPAVSKHLFV